MDGTGKPPSGSPGTSSTLPLKVAPQKWDSAGRHHRRRVLIVLVRHVQSHWLRSLRGSQSHGSSSSEKLSPATSRTILPEPHHHLHLGAESMVEARELPHYSGAPTLPIHRPPHHFHRFLLGISLLLPLQGDITLWSLKRLSTISQ